MPNHGKGGQGMQSPTRRITIQQKIFAEKLVSMGPLANAVKAAAFAGFAAPHVAVARLLAKPEIQAYITELRYSARLRNNIEVDDIINELAKIAFADVRELYDENGALLEIHKLDDKAAAAIKSIEVDEIGGRNGLPVIGETKKITSYDKLNALNQLRECLGFKEREMKIKRNAKGEIIETEETVNPEEHKVIFEDNSGQQEKHDGL